MICERASPRITAALADHLAVQIICFQDMAHHFEAAHGLRIGTPVEEGQRDSSPDANTPATRLRQVEAKKFCTRHHSLFHLAISVVRGEQWHALANIADLIRMLLWPNPTTYRGPKSRSKSDQCSQPGRCLESESRSVARSLSAEMRVGAPQRRVPTDSTPRTYFSGLSADRQSLFPHWWKGLLGDTPMR